MLVSTAVVGAIDLDELYKRAAQAEAPAPPPPAVDPTMAEWSTDSLMGMNSESDMGGFFEEMHKRHAARDQQNGMAKASSSAQTRSEHKAKLAKKKNDEAVKQALAKKAHEQKVAAAKAAARKAKAAAARKAAMQKARNQQVQKMRQNVQREVQKADSSRQHATMLTPHIFSEHHQPSIPHHRTHMLSAGVFGSHNVKKAHRKK